MSEKKSRIKLLIVDDHPVVRAGLSSMLGMHAEIDVVGTAASGAVALDTLALKAPNVILLDLRMPAMDGIGFLVELSRIGNAARVIILTSYERDEEIYRAMQAGAQGYLTKDATETEMVNAIMTVHGGKRFLPPHIAARLAERLLRSNLTTRENEILETLARGLTNKQIGRELHISENTVRNHVNSVIAKLEVSDRTEAATVAMQRGIIQIDP